MDQNFQTSFIPKKPIVEERVVAKAPTGLLMIISIFIFITVLIASLGLYLYKGSIAKDIVRMENDLHLAKARFEPAKITQLQELDKRLQAATQILNNHISVYPIFKSLSELTLKSVRYTKFSYDFSDSKQVNVVMSGQAVGYRSIALQSDLLIQNKSFKDPVFSNLSLNAAGNVLFDLEFSVDPSFVNYKQMLEREGTNIN